MAIGEGLIKSLHSRFQLGIRDPSVAFVDATSHEVMTGAWAVNVDLPPGPATYGTNSGFLGGAEPFGGTLRTQRTARHRPRSIAHGLTLLWRLRNNIDSIFSGWGVCWVGRSSHSRR